MLRAPIRATRNPRYPLWRLELWIESVRWRKRYISDDRLVLKRSTEGGHTKYEHPKVPYSSTPNHSAGVHVIYPSSRKLCCYLEGMGTRTVCDGR
jgi:hypothetical protein